MTSPLSRTSSATCDPSLASCDDARSPTPQAREPAVVTIAPVTITGDAGSQELLRRYDASQACNAEKQSVALACPAIAAGVLNALEGGPWTGAAASFHASVLCGKELRALFDCHEQAEVRQSAAAQVVDDCHDRGGNVRLGNSDSEIVCEVEP
jgi:hypothetical protein